MRKEDALKDEINFRKYVIKKIRALEKRISKIEKILFE